MFDAMKLRLRNDFRIKEGTDYAILIKYRKVAILCIEVYRARIEEVAEQHGIVVNEWRTLEGF